MPATGFETGCVLDFWLYHESYSRFVCLCRCLWSHVCVCVRALHASLNTQLWLSSMQSQWCLSTCSGFAAPKLSAWLASMSGPFSSFSISLPPPLHPFIFPHPACLLSSVFPRSSLLFHLFGVIFKWKCKCFFFFTCWLIWCLIKKGNGIF